MTYDDKARKADAEVLAHRKDNEKGVISPLVMHRALCVFVLDEKLRPILEILDPKAVEQAREALLLI